MEVYKPILTTFESDEKMYENATIIAVNQILNIIGEKGSARIALSGGKTPIPLYQKLFSNPFIEPELIELYQTDERFVPNDSDESNQKHILDSIGENKHYFKSINLINTALPINESISSYNEIIDSLDDVLFDLTILGIGSDGHFASLFPQGDYLNGFQPHVIHTIAKGFKTKNRISISINDILKSDMILVLLSGESKRHIVPELLEGSKVSLDFPAKFLLCHPNVTILESFQENG